MPIIQRENGHLAICRLDLDPQEFPRLLRANETDYLRAREIEMDVEILADDHFPPDQTIKFVQNVCHWGGSQGARIVGRVIGLNEGDDLVNAISDAHNLLQNDDPAGALTAMTNLNYLDVAFASKHLRMMAPNSAVTLDSVISECLGFPRDKQGNGYLDFLNHCQAILDIVNEMNIEHPYAEQHGDEWRLCDVEMAIYSQLLGN